jgi:branched-chain amino acid transport system substrate-binding protein
MIAPTNTYVGLTHAGPGAAPDEPNRYYPTGLRNYVRIIATDDVQGAADALLAKQLGLGKIYLVKEQLGNGYGAGLGDAFTITAHKLGLTIVGAGTWNYTHPRPTLLAAQARRLGADGVFIAAGAIEPPIGTMIQALHADAIKIIAPDAFSEFDKLVQYAGAAAQGVLVSIPGLPTERFPQPGKAFVAAFGRAVGQTPLQYSVYSAQAAAVLLDAIAHSTGTRNSVRTSLLRAKVSNGIIGSFSFNKNGDTTTGTVTIFQIIDGTPHVDRVLTANTRLLDMSRPARPGQTLGRPSPR